MLRFKLNHIVMIIAIFITSSNFLSAQYLRTPQQDQEQAPNLVNLIQERENLRNNNIMIHRCALLLLPFFWGSVIFPMMYNITMEWSLPLRNYTICNNNNHTVNIAYNRYSSWMSRPIVNSLDHHHCYKIKNPGSLVFLCAYASADEDFEASSDHVKCATKKGLQHNLEWYVGDDLFLHRGLGYTQESSKLLPLDYVTLAQSNDVHAHVTSDQKTLS